MRDASTEPHLEASAGRQLRQLRECLDRLLADGLRHGFFEMTVSVDTVQNHKRRVVIRAGKSHQFTIPEDELPL